jgi:hypothetical protein
MPDIEVSAPDGSSVSFPEGTSEDVIHQVMTRRFAPKPSVGEDVAQSAGSGLIGGLIGAASAGPGLYTALARGVEHYAPGLTRGIETATRAARRAIGIPEEGYNVPGLSLPPPEERELVERLAGPRGSEYQPQTTAGGYVKTAAEFAPQALTGFGGPVKRAITQALVPAAVSETAGQATKGTPYESAARMAGAAVGGLPGAFVGSRSVPLRNVREELPENLVNEKTINAAEDLIKRAQESGIALSWPEALSRVTGVPVLTALQRTLEGARQTRGQLANFYEKRGAAIDKEALRQFENISPTTETTPVVTAIGPQIQQAARQTEKDIEGIINKHTHPFYEQSRGIALDIGDHNALSQMPFFKSTLDEVRDKESYSHFIKDLPNNSIGVLDAMKKRLREREQDAIDKGNFNDADVMARTRHEITKSAEAASPFYEAALSDQARARTQFLEPLMGEHTILGKLKNTPEVTTAINTLFPHEPMMGTSGAVHEAVANLAKRNPLAAQQLVRAHLEDTFNRATRELVGGTNPRGAAGWVKNIIGHPQSYENLRAAIQALPDGEARWNTFEKFLDIAAATGRREPIGSATAFNQSDLRELSRGGRVAQTVGTALSPAKWFTFMSDLISNWQSGRNMGELAQVITDPGAGKTFRDLARSSNKGMRNAIASRLIAQTLGAGGRQPTPGERPVIDINVPNR